MPRTKQFEEQEVLDKAMHIFWRKGYHATSMQDLVQGMGINRASLYDTFGGKQELFLRALQNYKTQQGGYVTTFLKTAPPTRATLEKLFQNIALEAQYDSENKGCFMVNTTVELINVDERIRDIVLSNKSEVEAAFADFLKRMQESGNLSQEKNSGQLAKYFFSAMGGLRISAVAAQDITEIQQITQGILTALEN